MYEVAMYHGVIKSGREVSFSDQQKCWHSPLQPEGKVLVGGEHAQSLSKMLFYLMNKVIEN
jgi:hypothetical protein